MDAQVTAVPGREGGALMLEPPFELAGLHASIINIFAYLSKQICLRPDAGIGGAGFRRRAAQLVGTGPDIKVAGHTGVIWRGERARSGN
jgi:hypothetical protein